MLLEDDVGGQGVWSIVATTDLCTLSSLHLLRDHLNRMKGENVRNKTRRVEEKMHNSKGLQCASND
jgi:hypothetical protein